MNEVEETELPAVLESDFQSAWPAALSPFLLVVLVFCYRCFANSSPRLSCPLFSDSSPVEISAKEPSFSYQAGPLFDGMQQSRSRSSHTQSY